MGTDYVDYDSPCLCGQGTINVEQSSPDHMYAKESQIHYAGKLNCENCSKTYVIVYDHGRYPYLALREEVQAKAHARSVYEAAEKKFAANEAALSILPSVSAEIDAQKSMAAKHRILQKYRLVHESLPSYRKRPYGGAEAIKRVSGETLAYIGANFGLGGSNTATFKQAEIELKVLREASYGSPKVVTTGARWLRA